MVRNTTHGLWSASNGNELHAAKDAMQNNRGRVLLRKYEHGYRVGATVDQLGNQFRIARRTMVAILKWNGTVTHGPVHHELSIAYGRPTS